MMLSPSSGKPSSATPLRLAITGSSREKKPVSKPPWPSTRSLPPVLNCPPPPLIESLPSPPKSWSLPLPPSSESMSGPPVRTSSPSPPDTEVWTVGTVLDERVVGPLQAGAHEGHGRGRVGRGRRVGRVERAGNGEPAAVGAVGIPGGDATGAGIGDRDGVVGEADRDQVVVRRSPVTLRELPNGLGL